MKKYFLIILLALTGLSAYAQEHIRSDKTDSNGRRTITSNVCILTPDYFAGFNAVTSDITELYVISIMAFCEDSWSVKEGDKACFRTIQGKNVYLTALFDNNITYENGRYTITTSYKIPKENIYDMLDAISRITLDIEQDGRKTSKEFSVPFSSAENLMMTYLDVLLATGN